MEENYVLSAAGNNNEHDRSDDIMFTIKDTKLYIPVVTLSARDEQKLLKFLSKKFECSFYWNEHKTKGENKNKLFQFIQLKIPILKDLKIENITYLKA